jgi:hypothetical protein
MNLDKVTRIDTVEQLRALPVGTTMVDKDDVRLVKVGDVLYASDADLGAQAEGNTGRWTYFDEDEILGKYAEPAEPWFPIYVDEEGAS